MNYHIWRDWGRAGLLRYVAFLLNWSSSRISVSKRKSNCSQQCFNGFLHLEKLLIGCTFFSFSVLKMGSPSFTKRTHSSIKVKSGKEVKFMSVNCCVVPELEIFKRHCQPVFVMISQGKKDIRCLKF